MNSFSGMDGRSIKVEREIHDQFGIDELDHIPLMERLKMLFASKQSGSADLSSGQNLFERESKRAGMPPMDITVKKDDNNCSSQDLLICHSAFGFAKEVMDNYHPKDGLFSQEQGCFDKNHCSLYNDNSISNGSDYTDVPAIKVKSEIHDEQFSQKHIYFGTALERSITEVPNGEIAVDPYTVSLCSQNATGCQYDDMPKDCSWQGAKRNSGIYSNKFVSPEANSSVQPDNVVVNIHNQPQPQPQPHPQPENISVFPIKVKVEYPDDDQLSQCRECIHGTVGEDMQAIMIKSEIHNEVENDELDHTVLKKRQKMLLSRYPSGTAWRADVCGISEDGSKAQYADLIKDINQPSFLKSKEESTSADEQASFATSFSLGIPQTNASKPFGTAESDSSNGAIVEASCRVPLCSSKAITFQEIVSPNPTFNESDSMCSYHKTSAEFEEPGGGQEFIPPNSNNMLGTSLSTNPVKVKVETSEDILQSPCKSALGTFNGSLLPVKVELATPSVTYEDELDHMPLRERIKFLISKKVSKLDCSRNVKHLKKNVTSDQEGCPSLSENKYRGINRQRKRKKTATDSVETALEEDAPGLLQVLINKGITVDEIKLYGVEKEDDLDASFNADNFLELEVVISKLFSQRPSLLKFAPIRCRKEAKASYCLACLVSLVEQTRYLQFRKWPVEWGWCRDLQSFIFVFERHNRIVLERPEYGYATYFFELVDSLPISWQIKRLVTAMKLTSCSRITLIENRSLLVGDDLTEGEAQVLEEYGWTPNSGLGSMLNYCDRVVHDRRNESDGSEWRSKIGKLLMDGMNGGTIVVSNLPKKVIEYKDTHNSQIKLEL